MVKVRTLRHFFSLSGPHPYKTINFLALLSVGILLCEVTFPWLLTQIVAALTERKEFHVFPVITVLALGATRLALGLLHAKVNSSYTADAISRINSKMAVRCAGSALPTSQRSSTQIISLYSESLFVVEQFLDSVLWQTWIQGFYCIGAIIIVFCLGGPVVAFALIPFLVAILIGRKLRDRIEESLSSLQKQRGKMGDLFEDLLEGKPILIAYEAGKEAVRRFSIVEKGACETRKRALLLLSFYQPLFEGIALISLLVISFVGYSIFQRNPGDLLKSLTTVFYLLFLGRALFSVAPLLPMWDRFKVAINQLKELTQVPTELKTRNQTIERLTSGDAIVIQGLSFGYEPGSQVFQNLSLPIVLGKRTAITGPNGSGKSTLLKIISGELQPKLGSISIPSAAFGKEAKIAYLPQEPFLFRMSILENLRLISPEISEEDIWAVAKELGLEKFLARISGGLSHEVGGRGAALSGGERQKISLLRFVLRARTSDLCLLDEPTSYLDFESEKALMEALLKYCKGRTTLIISHRPWLVELCDRVIKMEELG